MPPRVDYDRVADAYDTQPYRAKEFDPDLAGFLAERPGLRPDVLDVGCGTGNQLVANRARVPEGTMAGLDPFAGMLRRARSKGARVAWVRGDGAALPFRDARFDFATSQYQFHHVVRQRSLVLEAARVLRPGGRFVLTNIEPHAMRESPLYRWFPAALARDLAEFPRTEDVEGWLSGAGLERVRVERGTWPVTQPLSAFLASVRRRDSCSQLLSIRDDEYAAGVAAIEGELRAGDRPVAHAVAWVRLSADRPGRPGGGEA